MVDAQTAPTGRGKIRLACVGDSITYGSGLSEREVNSYPAVLQKLLGEGYDVKNFGVSGATLLKSGDKPYWKQSEFKSATAFNPNIVVIKLGTNDTKPQNWSHKEEFAAVEEYTKDPNPAALLVFIADHLSIPADPRRMELQDRERYDRIRETLGEFCGVIELGRVEEGEAVRWATQAAEAEGVKLEADAARELVDAVGGDMTMIAGELEKLVLFVGEKKRITLGDVETMVLAAKQRSLYELTDAISAKDKARALEVLDGILATGDGEDAAIGHLYMLAKTFRQMLVISEKNVRDSRALWQVLWQGFRVPPFAAEDVIRQARRYQGCRELTRALRMIAKADLAFVRLRAKKPGTGSPIIWLEGGPGQAATA